MLKRKIFKKIFVTSSILFAISLSYFLPREKELKNIPQILEYSYDDIVTETIFLLDNNNYLSKTTVVISTNKLEETATELLEVLINDGIGESKVPNGFRTIIPSDTKINSVVLENNVLKVNFSKELLNTSKELEEKIIESIVYTLTSLEGIDKVMIYVDGELLTKLPQSNINLPTILDRSFGINKEYNITNYKEINQVTIYYINKHNNNTYYVPVTKYINDEREKVQIIIDELSSSPIYTSNLMSYLNSNTKLLKANIEEDQMILEFNNYIFSDIDRKNILEEVIYTICLSISDNYSIDKVEFVVNEEDIYTSLLEVFK